MSPRLRTPLRGAAPIVLVTALVAVLGIAGTAGAAKLITGSSIKDGSITAADLSKKTRTSLKGAAGARGIAGSKGDRGSVGPLGMTGTAGAAGAAGYGRGGWGAWCRRVARAARHDWRLGTNGAPGADAVRYFAAVAADGTLSGRASGTWRARVDEVSTGTFTLQSTGRTDFSTALRCRARGRRRTAARASLPTLAGVVGVLTTDNAGAVSDHAFVLTVSC